MLKRTERSALDHPRRRAVEPLEGALPLSRVSRRCRSQSSSCATTRPNTSGSSSIIRWPQRGITVKLFASASAQSGVSQSRTRAVAGHEMDRRRRQKREPTGTLSSDEDDAVTAQKKAPEIIGGSSRAGDRGRTGDVQLGKLAFYR